MIIQYVNLVDNKGMTPLHYAVKRKNLDLVKLLMDYNDRSALPRELEIACRLVAVFENCQKGI